MRKVVGLVISNLLALVFACLGLEAATLALGVHFPAIARPGNDDRGLWRYDSTKGWSYAPNAAGQSSLGGPDAGHIKINSHGYRGKDFRLQKPPETYRVLVLGDSFAFGLGVNVEHSLPAVLQGLLTQSLRRPEVINMAVSGYSTDQQIVLYREVGSRLAPDLVILVACDNDFEGNLQDFAYNAYYKPYFATNGEPTLKNVPVPTLSGVQQTKLWLGRHSNVWNAFRSRRSSVPVLSGFLAWFQVATPRTAPGDAIETMATLTKTLAHDVSNTGAKFLLINTGHRGERTPLFQELRPRLRVAGVRFLGLEANFEKARAESPSRYWDFGQDTHWNVEAHRLAAAVIYEYIKTILLSGAPVGDA